MLNTLERYGFDYTMYYPILLVTNSRGSSHVREVLGL